MLSLVLLLLVSIVVVVSCVYDDKLKEEGSLLSSYYSWEPSLANPKMPNGWSSCGDASDLFKIKSFTLTPDPPRRSKQLVVHIAGELAKSLNGGYVNYTVHFGVIPIVQDKLEICDALELEPKLPHCPLKAGKWNIKHAVEMPSAVPFGRYTISASGWDKDGEKRIFCVKGTTTIGLLVANDSDEKFALLQDQSSEELEEQEEEEKEEKSKFEAPGDRQVVFPHDVATY